MPLFSTRGAGSAKGFGLTAGSGPIQFNYLVVAGGAASTGGPASGGGGAGGLLTLTGSKLPKGTVLTATIGAGGAVSPATQNGGDSSLIGTGFSITTTGGGKSASLTGQGTAGGSGGGGGGAYYFNSGDTLPRGNGGSGNTPATTPSQGNNAGQGSPTAWSQGSPNNPAGGAGGGAGAVGAQAQDTIGGNGGIGVSDSIIGSPTYYAGGGGGAGITSGQGGQGGGGNGGTSAGSGGQAGQANTGGGAGGGAGSSGGSGVIIISVPTSKYSGTSTGSPTITTSGANTILKFTGTGTYTT